MPPEGMVPYRQGRLDSLCGLYAAINAMRWATRDDNIEDEFWGEVFDSLVLCTDAHVGMAHVLIAGVGPKPLLKILREVFASVEFRLGRRFEAYRPLRGAVNTMDCFMEQLTWFTEQPLTAVMLILEQGTPHWTTLKELDGRRLLLIDSMGREDIDVDEHRASEGETNPSGLIVPKSVIVIERVKR